MCWKQKSAHQNEIYKVLSSFLDFNDTPTQQEYENLCRYSKYKLFYSIVIINCILFLSQILKLHFYRENMALLYSLIIAIVILLALLICLKKIQRYTPLLALLLQICNFAFILENYLSDQGFSEDISQISAIIFMHTLLSILLCLCFNKWILRSIFLLASWEYMIFRCKIIESIELPFIQFQIVVVSAILILYFCEQHIKQQFGELFYERANLKEHSRILDDLMPSSLLILQKGPLGFQCIFKNQKSKNEFFNKESKGNLIVNKMLKEMTICRENQSKNEQSQRVLSSSPNNQHFQNQMSNLVSSDIAAFNSAGISTSNLFQKQAEENYLWMKQNQIKNLYDLLSIKHNFRSVIDEKQGTLFTYQDQYYDVKIVWKNSRQILVLLNNISEKINAEKLQELDEYKDKLLASVCHDIKTPVCQLIQFLNFALEKGVNKIPEDSRNFIEISLKTTGLLMYLISDILDYSQMKKKIFRLRIDKFNLRDVLEEVIDLFKFQAEQKGLQLSLNYKQGCFLDIKNIIVFNDSNRIKQVLINLISNALKFTQQGRIIISISTIGENSNLISISVQDTGIGMSEEIKAKLFQQYSTFNQEGLNKNGIGLGLNNCKTIVGELGPTSQFQVESVQNEGSIFTFQIYQNNNKYAEQIKEEEQEEEEEQQLQHQSMMENQQNEQDKNGYEKQNYQESIQHYGEVTPATLKNFKNHSVSYQTFDDLKCRAFSQNNELTSNIKDKRSTLQLQENSNQSGNIVIEEYPPYLLPNQYESPVKKLHGEQRVTLESRKSRFITRSSAKSNMHESQDLDSFGQMNIQEYQFANPPPNQVYPSIHFQTSQLISSVKQIEQKLIERSLPQNKQITDSQDNKNSFIQNYSKNSNIILLQPTTEEASYSDQSSNLTINTQFKQSSPIKNYQKKHLLNHQQYSFSLASTPKERTSQGSDEFIQAKSMRLSFANLKLKQYQKPNPSFLRFGKEIEYKYIQNRQKSSKSEALQQTQSPTLPFSYKNIKENIPCKPKHNILIVDDNQFNILALKLLISENENIIVYQAENGEQAVQKAKQMNFKLIFMDMQMPIMDGQTASQIIKQDLKIATPIISLTANEYTNEEKKQLTMFEDFLNKPIQKQKVHEILQKYRLI
ncbi:ATPase, histidine kinase-, DNA gyrase B (macronuclear) [Tetrahymena thermophila SB210]|uniref:ATPase, histidine kinase-, DNA gyrase B n=1 Tax=Tetrahymena thermophila (strain SB210) TaxID=312017 RepID=I7M8X5_TETTS|nr:ATPase, histidine kinase-, DNA gyrase B [Tetrahymena thermophila SB210]EAS00236.2 ATPase, histidine kinase-, DNA gyrase B [Tetrahymena thermophila SB210]|eukprot:XP_001020481.2 ATPase, histidine kinase-, DNA gyrase B [Tetrahymena thermophila SB210]